MFLSCQTLGGVAYTTAVVHSMRSYARVYSSMHVTRCLPLSVEACRLFEVLAEIAGYVQVIAHLEPLQQPCSAIMNDTGHLPNVLAEGAGEATTKTLPFTPFTV